MKTCRKGLHQYDGKTCLECKRQNDAAYRSAHRGEIRAYNLAYRSANRERLRLYDVERGALNPQRGKGYKEAWKKSNPDRVRTYNAAWWGRNRELACEYQHRRRIIKLGNLGNEPVTKEHLKLLFDAQEGCCRYCRMPLGKDKHLDHRIPLARGGAHAPSNVCWSCPKCNRRKHVKTEQEFLNG